MVGRPHVTCPLSLLRTIFLLCPFAGPSVWTLTPQLAALFGAVIKPLGNGAWLEKVGKVESTSLYQLWSQSSSVSKFMAIWQRGHYTLLPHWATPASIHDCDGPKWALVPAAHSCQIFWPQKWGGGKYTIWASITCCSSPRLPSHLCHWISILCSIPGQGHLKSGLFWQ